MNTSEFDYDLPAEYIAQYPPVRRGGSKLLVLDRKTGHVQHFLYSDIPRFLRPDDVVILNRTKVMKARVNGTVVRTGKHVEILFLDRKLDRSPDTNEQWYCLIGRAKHVVVGDEITTAGGKRVFVVGRCEDDPRHIVSGDNCEEIMKQSGTVPLPPYIKREATLEDENRYNTVFGTSLDSAAAPTASLNLTETILTEIRARCAAVCYLDLHIGLGTFRPIDTERVEDYKIHGEFIIVPQDTVEAVNTCKGRVWAFGTTVVRSLESAAVARHRLREFKGETKLFIYPGFSFKIVDVLVTNFHMPRTSLIALVSAFVGRKTLMKAYETAKQNSYKFLSYGDSMLVGDFGLGT
jgi:S-adenosylmethionine:tRNA ribosyltransferase-isomerase